MKHMKSLYESITSSMIPEGILDDQETIINNANTRFEDQAKLNVIIDKLHEDTLNLLNPTPGDVQKEAPKPAYKDYECYTLSKKRNILHKLSSLFINTYKEANSKIDGELWSTTGRGMVSMFYIPKQGGRILVYRYCQRPHGVNREVAIFKKVF